jgi:hypothetical protein
VTPSRSSAARWPTPSRGSSILDFHIHTHRPMIELSTRAILILVGCLLLQMWQYRVPTRLEVRDLFYGKP